MAELTHVRADGSAHMVDVGHKPTTQRTAVARGTVKTRADVIDALVDGSLPKGEALGTARIAGILGAKQTPSLIPLCHPLPIGGVEIDLDAAGERVLITATVSTSGQTGVEMEALTAVSIAALTVFDMIKAVDKHARITDIEVVSKSGGKSGEWSRFS